MGTKYLVDGHNEGEKVFFSDSFNNYNLAKSHATELEKDFNIVTIRKVETEEIYRSKEK